MENKKIVHMTIKSGQKPTKKQLLEIENAVKLNALPDEDTPELTLEQYKEMAEIAKLRKTNKNKLLVTIRISSDTLNKAKATGKGYTGFLSRLLDNAINDPKLVTKSL